MKLWSVYPIRFLLSALCEHPERLSPQEKDSAGSVARNLLEFALSQYPRDQGLVGSGIETVCRTYDSDPLASNRFLSRLLAPECLKEYGYEDLPTLARESQKLLKVAPDFVRDIYVAGFGYKETNTDKTAMGPGRILSLTSNRRQDYNHGLWQLSETFPSFLNVAPSLAIEALIAAVSAHVDDLRHDKSVAQQFDFRGAQARIKSDASYIWDASSRYRHDDYLRMLDAFEEELHRIANEPSLINVENEILNAVATKNIFASLWRTVLRCGARNPGSFGKRVCTLAYSLPILTGVDTSDLAGNFIKAIYPEIGPETRVLIENSILSIPKTMAANRNEEVGQRIRDRLLGCIPEALTCVNESKEILATLSVQGGPPPNRPPFQVGSAFSRTYTDSQLLADQGVPIDAEPNQKIIRLAEPLKVIVEGRSQDPLKAQEIDSTMAAARTLHTALLMAERDGAHEVQVENGWYHLVRFCKIAARCDGLSCDTDQGKFVRQTLLEGARRPSTSFH